MGMQGDKLIVNFTPTGMVPTKEMTPHVPITVDEIVKDVLVCAEYGVSIVHLHARDESGAPTCRKETYGEIIGRIRERRPDLILCASTSGRLWPELEKRAEVLDLAEELRPEMASLTLGSMNFSRTASVNSPDMIKALASRMKDRGVKPELEVFDFGMVNFAKYLARKGMLRGPHYFNILLGNLGTAQPDLLTAGHIIRELPDESIWALAGIGGCQHRMTSLGILMGGHVRIGLEDNIFFDEGRKTLATNEMLVRRVYETARALGREIATPDETRMMLGLERRAPEPVE